jgi:sulfate adenylyltransferase
MLLCSRGGDGLIEPHGGALKKSMVTDPAQKKKLIAECEGRKIECSDRNACDVELLAVGGFSPLDGFMNQVWFLLDLPYMTHLTRVCWSLLA